MTEPPLYRQSLADLLEGSPPLITSQDFEIALAKLVPAWTKLKNTPDACTAAIMQSCMNESDLPQIGALAAKLRQSCQHLLIIGSGGSSLSAKALAPLAPRPNNVQLHVIDHVDPIASASLIRSLPLEKTAVLIISKSGHTMETLAVVMTLFAYAESQNINLAEHTAVITVSAPNPLREFARIKNIRILDHDPNLCGRFSVLSAVGLLPAAVMGVDIRALRQGARSVMTAAQQAASVDTVEAARGAAIQALMIERNYPISVFMAYGEAFTGLVWWHRQGWAESLGKNGQGATPYASFGTSDQHSQLQLYLDGAHDKSYTLLLPECKGLGDIITIPESIRDMADHLHGRTVGDVMAAEVRATYESMRDHGLPIRLLRATRMDAETLGALFAHFMLEIIFTAALLDINPFDQLAVEASKAKARQYLAELEQ